MASAGHHLGKQWGHRPLALRAIMGLQSTPRPRGSPAGALVKTREGLAVVPRVAIGRGGREAPRQTVEPRTCGQVPGKLSTAAQQQTISVGQIDHPTAAGTSRPGYAVGDPLLKPPRRLSEGVDNGERIRGSRHVNAMSTNGLGVHLGSPGAGGRGWVDRRRESRGGGGLRGSVEAAKLAVVNVVGEVQSADSGVAKPRAHCWLFFGHSFALPPRRGHEWKIEGIAKHSVLGWQFGTGKTCKAEREISDKP